MNKSKKQPWNPFPLASLKVMDVSPCAKVVLIYLAARSNWKGETCVGVRTIARELMKSQRFVINGLKELREKKYVAQSLRDRRVKEADWKVLGQSILSGANSSTSGALASPEHGPHQVQIVPSSGEANAPLIGANVEAEPYRPSITPFNLTEGNLSDKTLVSKKASSLWLSQDEEQEQNPLGFQAEENPNPRTDIGEDDDEEYVITHTDEEVLAELGKCFSVFKSQVKPKPEEIALMREIMTKCDDWCMYPSTAMEYARKHKQNKRGLIPASVQRLWDATCADDISSTNSLLAQTKDHRPQDCLICKMAIKNVMCGRCAKFNVFIKPDGTASDHCAECNKLPTYRLESGQRQMLRGDV